MPPEQDSVVDTEFVRANSAFYIKVTCHCLRPGSLKLDVARPTLSRLAYVIANKDSESRRLCNHVDCDLHTSLGIPY
jgi:hypothetical protein